LARELGGIRVQRRERKLAREELSMLSTRTVAVLVSVGAALVMPAWSQTVTRLSVDGSGAQANGPSSRVAASSDGRWVVLSSAATNLVANDTNGGHYDVFLLDRNTGALELVSVDTAGVQHAVDSFAGGVSDDGRFIAFLSDALDPGDTDFTRDVYLRDRQTGVTHWVSQENAFDDASACALSRDGATVGYSSFSFSTFGASYHVRRPLSGGQWDWIGSNLSSQFSSSAAGALASNGQFVAVHQSSYNGYWTTQWTELLDLNAGVPISIAGAPRVLGMSHDAGYLAYLGPSGLIALESATGIETVMIPGAISGVGPVHLSDDGRYAAFESDAADIVAGDSNGVYDVFVHDRLAHTTLRVSLSAAGAQSNDASNGGGMLLGDGSRVLFASLASNLVPGDTNGVFDVFERTNCFPHAADLDGDGYGSGAASLMCVPVAAGLVPNTLDCDDADPARSPSAMELCNGIDDDCDGAIDDSLVFAWWRDFDGDGFGDAAVPLATCAPPAGYVANALDCDDTNNAVKPGALELCNGIDDNCNGAIDEGLLTTFFLDADGDGFGAAGLSLLACTQPSGYVLNALDCDDARASAYPGAPELCNGLDEDCDGAVDEGFQGAPYCANSFSSIGCVPQIGALGSPRASASSGFTVQVTQMDGQRSGVLFYGLAPTSLPWALFNPSTLCIAGQRQRMGLSTSSGTANQCNGVLARDVLAFAAATPGALATPFSAGTTLYFQGWLRDPLMPTGSILTSGWSTTLCP